MASTANIYKHGVLLGTATISDSSTSVTSWTKAHSLIGPVLGRYVQIVNTQAGTHQGRSWSTRINADNGSGTLTINDKCPHGGA